MKKGCLGVFVGLIILCGGGAGFFYQHFNTQLGLSEAPEVSYVALVQPDMRVLAKLDTDKMADYLLNIIPEEALAFPDEVPAWIPWEMDEAILKVLPREIALLGSPDIENNALDFTLFANERRLGPAIMERANAQDVLAQAPMVKWAAEKICNPERGVLTVDGALEVPKEIKAKVRANWDGKTPAEATELEGKHLFELAMNNQNGESFALIGGIAQAVGADWQEIFGHPQFKIAENILIGLKDLTLNANITSRDQLTINLRINCPQKTGKQIEFLTRAALPTAREALEKKQGMILKGSPKWDEKEEAILATFTLSGFADKIVEAVTKNLSAPAEEAA